MPPKLQGAKYHAWARSMDNTVWATIDFELPKKHFSEAELEQLRIVFNERGEAVYNSTGRILDTTDDQEWMYVMDVSGNLYVGPRLSNQYHSALAGGSNPIGAGVVEAKSGEILYLNEESGHYKLKEHVWVVIEALKAQGFKSGERRRVWFAEPSPYEAFPDDRRKDAVRAQRAERVAAANTSAQAAQPPRGGSPRRRQVRFG